VSYYVQVIEVNPIVERAAKQGGKAQKTAECVVGDETGTIVFSARNEQGNLSRKGNIKPASYRSSMSNLLLTLLSIFLAHFQSLYSGINEVWVVSNAHQR
jgi:hypothetical protein